MTCECNPKCDDCDCREKIDISTPHFEDHNDRDCQIDAEDLTCTESHDGFPEYAFDTTETDADESVEEVTIKPDSGHHTIRDYTSTETAFAFSEPDKSTKKQLNDAIDEYLARPSKPATNDYEKIANRRFTDYLKDEFTVFSVSDYFSTIVHYNDTRHNIQPTKESIYTLKDELKWVNRLLATGDEFSLILYTRLTFDELKTKQSKIVRQIDQLESQLNDLFYDKYDYSAKLS